MYEHIIIIFLFCPIHLQLTHSLDYMFRGMRNGVVGSEIFQIQNDFIAPNHWKEGWMDVV